MSVTLEHVIKDRLLVCAVCGHLRGPWRYQGDTEDRLQRCACDRSDHRSPQPRWPGFDHNTVAELCRCCAIELLGSGSKWSVWFCRPCLTRVRGLNERAGRCVVPIGRHSLMNGIGYRLDGRRDDEAALLAFGDQLQTFLRATEGTEGWRRRVVRRNLVLFGLGEAIGVPVNRYLLKARRAGLSREDAFERLRAAAHP
jgi:hypothetical protein